MALPAAAGENEVVTLLDGGAEAFPRMRDAIAQARSRIYLEVYAFDRDATGERFVEALRAAKARGCRVRVVMDGWGSLFDGRGLERELEAAGVEVIIFNRFTATLLGRWQRDHRKLLVVDDEVAFAGGLNIGDAYSGDAAHAGWADLAVELRGPAAARLAQRVWHEKVTARGGGRVRVSLSGGGHRLRQRYVKAFGRAQREIWMAQAYFLPDRHLIRSLTAAARRGVKVHLLLAGNSDVLLAHSATMRLHRQLLDAGVDVYEWTESVLHAKVAAVDGRHMLVGSFNFDPLSLANLEALVEVRGPEALKARAWIADRVALGRRIRPEDCRRNAVQRFFLDGLGLFAARVTQLFAREAGRSARHLPIRRG